MPSPLPCCCSTSALALTTIRQPLIEKGIAAGERLFQQAHVIDSKVLETTLVGRDSLGLAPADYK